MLKCSSVQLIVNPMVVVQQNDCICPEATSGLI